MWAILIYLGTGGFTCVKPSVQDYGPWIWRAAYAERVVETSARRDRLMVVREGDPTFADLLANCVEVRPQ